MKFESMFVQTDMIEALFMSVAAAASGRRIDEFRQAKRTGGIVEVDYGNITHQKFFSTIGLICCHHGELFNKTRTEIKAMIDEGFEAAFMSTLVAKDIEANDG